MNIREQKVQKTKATILEATYKIIKREGLSQLSANKISKESGISKGGIFHHFPQMEDLYLYMLDLLMNQFSEDLDPSNFKSFEEYVDFISKYLFQFLDQAPEVMTTLFYFISESSSNEKYKLRVRKIFENSFDVWADKLDYFFDKRVKPSKKDALIRLLDIYFVGFCLHYQILGDQNRYKKLTKDFMTMIIGFIGEE